MVKQLLSRRGLMCMAVILTGIMLHPRAWAVEDRFSRMPKLNAAAIPASGRQHKALAGVDQVIKQFMARKGIGALTFALSLDGKIVHDRAFGWADAKLTAPLQPGVKMRVASLTKPVVKAAIRTLIAEGELNGDDRVFEVLQLGRFPEAKSCDPRFRRVTIQQLLEHEGGWDRDKSGDLSDRPTKIAKLFDLDFNEITPRHIVRYGLTLPLDFDPGEREVYCNFGYILLARVIEQVSGQGFMDYVRSTVARKSGAPSFGASSSDGRDRQPGEIWYCYHPEYPEKEVPLRFRTEARDGAGILACTAADYCRFLGTYWVNGRLRKGGPGEFWFDGSHPGVTSICSQRRDGVNYVAIANRRDAPGSEWGDELRDAIDAALDEVEDER